MDRIRVLVYVNRGKGLLNVKAMEGEEKGRVIARVREIVLTECRVSRNKDKTAGIIGFLDEKLQLDHPSSALRRYFGSDEEDDEGFNPIYYGEAIRYDPHSKRYIVDDEGDFSGFSPETLRHIQTDPILEQAALDYAAFIHLEIEEDEEEEEDAGVVRGLACYWRRSRAVPEDGPGGRPGSD